MRVTAVFLSFLLGVACAGAGSDSSGTPDQEFERVTGLLREALDAYLALGQLPRNVSSEQEYQGFKTNSRDTLDRAERERATWSDFLNREGQDPAFSGPSSLKHLKEYDTVIRDWIESQRTQLDAFFGCFPTFADFERSGSQGCFAQAFEENGSQWRAIGDRFNELPVTLFGSLDYPRPTP